MTVLARPAPRALNTRTNACLPATLVARAGHRRLGGEAAVPRAWRNVTLSFYFVTFGLGQEETPQSAGRARDIHDRHGRRWITQATGRSRLSRGPGTPPGRSTQSGGSRPAGIGHDRNQPACPRPDAPQAVRQRRARHPSHARAIADRGRSIIPLPLRLPPCASLAATSRSTASATPGASTRSIFISIAAPDCWSSPRR